MTQRERTKLRKAIALLYGDYGYESAMTMLNELHGPYTDAELAESERGDYSVEMPAPDSGAEYQPNMLRNMGTPSPDDEAYVVFPPPHACDIKRMARSLADSAFPDLPRATHEEWVRQDIQGAIARNRKLPAETEEST